MYFRKPLFFKFSLTVFGVVGMIWFYQTLCSLPQFSIHNIEIMGNFSDKTKQTLQENIQSVTKEGLLRCNTRTLRTHLLKRKPWIKNIIIHRKLPGTLVIHIQPRSPAAVFKSPDQNNLQWIDASGKCFTLVDSIPIAHIPTIIGPMEKLFELFQWYKTISALLTPQALQMNTLALRDNDCCVISLTNGIELLLGRQNPCKQLKQTLNSYPFVLHQPDRIASIDLRYSNGMAITLRESSYEKKI
jgi:cell division protein FtsQ